MYLFKKEKKKQWKFTKIPTHFFLLHLQRSPGLVNRKNP